MNHFLFELDASLDYVFKTQILTSILFNKQTSPEHLMLICQEVSKYIPLNKVETKDLDGKIITVPLGREFSSANVEINSEQKSDKEDFRAKNIPRDKESFQNDKVVN